MCIFNESTNFPAPRMSINGDEVASDNLIDNDVTTCELFPVGDGCKMGKVCLIVESSPKNTCS